MDNASLWRWYGLYCESLGDGDQAVVCYRKANSHADLARIFCHAGEWERAVRVAEQSGDRYGEKKQFIYLFLHVFMYLFSFQKKFKDENAIGTPDENVGERKGGV